MKTWIKLVFGASPYLSILVPIFGKPLDSPDNLTRGIVYEQHPGALVSPTLIFVDEQGRKIQLGDYFGRRPVVLALGYYGCPVLCGVSLNATTRTLQEFPPESAARDFAFIFVSIDPRESFVVAAEKKRECLRKLVWAPAEERWHFLTGAKSAAALAEQVGFHFRYDSQSKQYIHPSGLVILSPEGRITSYLPGIDYPRQEFERALAGARYGETVSNPQLISILCFSNERLVGSVSYYVLMALRIGAVLTLGGLILIVRLKPRHFGQETYERGR